MEGSSRSASTAKSDGSCRGTSQRNAERFEVKIVSVRPGVCHPGRRTPTQRRNSRVHLERVEHWEHARLPPTPQQRPGDETHRSDERLRPFTVRLLRRTACDGVETPRFSLSQAHPDGRQARAARTWTEASHECAREQPRHGPTSCSIVWTFPSSGFFARAVRRNVESSPGFGRIVHSFTGQHHREWSLGRTSIR